MSLRPPQRAHTARAFVKRGRSAFSTGSVVTPWL